MTDLIKFIKEIVSENPELKRMIEEDDKWKDERKELYLSRGLDEKQANMAAWNDYWEMAYHRDGVEFSVNKLK